MPRPSKKKAGRCLKNHRIPKADICDVTINEFANSDRNSTTTRLKKICINNVVTSVKNLCLADDRTWDKKLDDIDCIAMNFNFEQSLDSRKPTSRRRKKTSQEETVDDDSGVRYPQEIWFLIAAFVKPEDVGIFSAICKDSLAVVNTSHFWYDLYKRYYRKVDDLPVRLQPENMVRNYGLRALVIRALYFMYPPFVNKMKSQVIFDGDPHVLTKRQCVLSWSQKNKNQWLFYFKLKQASRIKFGRGNDEDETKHNLMDILEDITANVDDKCKVLQVTCFDYIPLPMIIGETLCSVSLTLSRNVLYHRLQLNFGRGPTPYMGNNFIVFDPVVNLRVLDWWHPLFPHSDGPMSISSSTEGSILCEDHEYDVFFNEEY